MDPREEPAAINRLSYLIVAALLWTCLILFRLVSLQIFGHEEYSRQAQQQHVRRVEIAAQRGAIFDRSGQPLAMSLEVESVCINPMRVPNKETAAEVFSRVLGLDRDKLLDEIERAAQQRRGFLWIQRKITREQAATLKSLPFDWIEFRTESLRQYPNESLAAHVVGSVDHEEKGNAGIEMSMDAALRGRPGFMRMYTDVRRRGFDSEVAQKPVPGKNLTLTIDERIQYVAERQLKEAVEANRCETGSLVVMDPNTGDILAMANYPTFNPNVPPATEREMEARHNLAVSVPFEPGSVFKVITLSAALETTRVRPDTMIACGNGSMTLFRRVIHDHHAYSSLSMADVLAKSSNIGTIRIGLEVGEARLLDYVRRFGFGSLTGLPLPAESAGMVRKLEHWTKSSIGSVAMGHEISATSVQLARAASVVANGGLLVQPRILLKQQRPGERPEFEQAEEPRRVIKPETAITMRAMMERVVLPGGTGTKARLNGWSSGGKTGSAQIFDLKARKYTHRYNASFMGFAPLTNPRVVVVVTLNGSTKYGGAVAAPVFREVAAAALRILDVQKDLPEFLPPSEEPLEKINDLAIASLAAPEDDREQVDSLAAMLRPASMERSSEGPLQQLYGPRVPNFQGKSMRAVLEESAAAGVPVEFVGTGIARGQFPPPGSILPLGERVRVQFAR